MIYPIRFVRKHAKQKYCGECWADLRKIPNGNLAGLYECTQCGLLYVDGNRAMKVNNDVVFVMVRAYFSRMKVSDIILHYAYDMNEMKLSGTAFVVRNNIRESIKDISTPGFEDFFCKDNLECIFKMESDSRQSKPLDVNIDNFHILINKGKVEKSFEGNIEIIEDIPNIHVFFSVLWQILNTNGMQDKIM